MALLTFVGGFGLKPIAYTWLKAQQPEDMPLEGNHAPLDEDRSLRLRAAWRVVLTPIELGDGVLAALVTCSRSGPRSRGGLCPPAQGVRPWAGSVTRADGKRHGWNRLPT